MEVFSSNYALYGDMSRRVMEILGQRAAAVEVYSIGEAFLDLSSVAFGCLESYGRSAQHRAAMDRSADRCRHRGHEGAGQGGTICRAR